MTYTQVQPVSRVKIEAVVIATGVNTFFGKAAHLVENTTHVGHFQKVLTSIGNFCICSIAVGIVIEIIVVISQGRKRRESIDNLLVLLIGGIPIAMPTVLSVTMAIGSHRLSQQWMPLVEFVEQPLIQEDRMFKKIMDICIARLGKRYCRLSAPHLVSKFDGKLSSLYYNIVKDQDFTCQVS